MRVKMRVKSGSNENESWVDGWLTQPFLILRGDQPVRYDGIGNSIMA